MRLVIVFICLTVLSGYVANADEQLSRQSKQSALEADLERLANTDVSKLAVYTELVKLIRRTDPQQALKYGEQGVALHFQHNAAGEHAKLIGYLTKIYLERGQLDVAAEMIERGLELANKSGDTLALSVNLFNQALRYQLSNQLILAISSYQALETVYQDLADNARLASTYNNLGIIYFKLGNFDQALRAYQKALPLYSEQTNSSHYANTLMNIGEVFYWLNDYRQAEQNYLLGLEQIDPQSAPLSHLEGKQRLGMLYLAQKRFVIAREHFERALELALIHELTSTQITLYFELIKLAAETNDTLLMQSSLVSAEQLMPLQTKSELLTSIDYFRAFVASYNGDWQRAEQSIDRLFNNKLFKPRYFVLQDAFSLAFKIKARLGKAEQANELILKSFNHYQQHQEDNRDIQFSQYAQLYKTDQKEHQLAVLKQQATLQENERLKAQQTATVKTFVFVLISLILLMLVLVFSMKTRSLRRENQLSNQLMSEKKQFFADISHELRTPLTVFKLKMEELEYDIADDPKTVYKLLHERIDSFNCLINDISLLALNDRGELELDRETFALQHFFERRAAELQVLAERHSLSVQINIRLSAWHNATLDGARIRQVLTNLFSNACRYTNSPGNIVFTVEVNNDELLWSIEDSSPALEPEQYQKIFNRLYRADKSRSRKLGGSGLGLAICRDLICAHHGSISAEPSSLGGVKVSVNIPLNQ
ncbi:tetratricopeptide repeat protein [Endozoicomonas sp. G2_1]|uniref:ATP-binding protein n=1 Tax=Endozoicomonas sp. G2_1 TaxID=2821091 RepID=UPI001AD99F32|nr:ATP-binding protein [Endozoicomonas sp. G2_1]MBO9491467.1 tetratricopeptide repeat protein [Endozoicomonas sp. G2_1]